MAKVATVLSGVEAKLAQVFAYAQQILLSALAGLTFYAVQQPCIGTCAHQQCTKPLHARHQSQIRMNVEHMSCKAKVLLA